MMPQVLYLVISGAMLKCWGMTLEEVQAQYPGNYIKVVLQR